MTRTVGIRREDKSEWERRVPLNPTALADLQGSHDVRFQVQPSEIRVYTDDDYRAAGIAIEEDLGEADLVFAVKEIPADLLRPGKTYVYFSHVIKGQPQNMPMLRRLMELGCSLVDYEKIVDLQGRRLVFFSLHAGYAGMIETLWCLGKRLAARGVDTPLNEVRHAYEYGSLDAALEHLRGLGERIRAGGLDPGLRPIMFGLAGYGNVSRGCQEMLDALGATEVPVADLAGHATRADEASPLLRVVFKEEDMVEPVAPGGTFDLQDYYGNPEKYRGTFARHLPCLDVLVNAIYWDERYPRLVTKAWARESYTAKSSARLQVIGDISCDLEGGIELTVRTTPPDVPGFVYDPSADDALPGVDGVGPVVMAVDNLPCELPREASDHFSDVLREMVPDLVRADWTADFAELALPPSLKGAVIVHQGRLTSPYTYLQHHLES